MTAAQMAATIQATLAVENHITLAVAMTALRAKSLPPVKCIRMKPKFASFQKWPRNLHLRPLSQDQLKRQNRLHLRSSILNYRLRRRSRTRRPAPRRQRARQSLQVQRRRQRLRPTQHNINHTRTQKPGRFKLRQRQRRVLRQRQRRVLRPSLNPQRKPPSSRRPLRFSAKRLPPPHLLRRFKRRSQQRKRQRFQRQRCQLPSGPMQRQQ